MSFINKLEKFDLFHPLILVAIVILFLIIAIPSWTTMGELKTPNIQLYIYIALGLIFFILGLLFVRFISPKINLLSKISSFEIIAKNTEKLDLFDKYSLSLRRKKEDFFLHSPLFLLYVFAIYI